MKHIRSVVSVDLSLLKSHPPQLLISALGTVPTGGWKNGTLEPRFYIVPPTDGIQDFDFAADPPVGPAIDVILPIAAQTMMESISSWLKGVRVHSATNNVEALLASAKSTVDIK
jgi:hypothetical protein